MKNILKPVAGACLLAGLSLASCSDWTEVESLGVAEPSIEQQNGDLYARYSESLRNYRNTRHKQVFAWFDNSEKVPSSQAHHITALPDSVDVIGMIHPEGLAGFELEDMAKVRSQKGMKVIYSIDFDQIKSIFNERKANAPKDNPVKETFHEFLADSLAHALSIYSTYGYDGLSISYKGKSVTHATAEEKKEIQADENAFVGAVKDWVSTNNVGMLVFQGGPQYLLDNSILEKCDVIFVSGTEALSADGWTVALEQAMVDQYSDRYGMFIAMPSLDEADTETGMFADGTTAVSQIGAWGTQTHDGHDVAAVALYNAQTDYYTDGSGETYSKIRSAIGTLNPAVK